MENGTEESPFAGKHLLLVGTGGVKRRRVLAALRSLGLGRITCLHDEVNWARPLVDDWIVADSVRPSPATTALVRERIGAPDAVLTYDDYSVVVAAHLAGDLGLVGMPPVAVERAKNKAAFRKICRDHGLPAARSVRVDPAEPRLDDTLPRAAIELPVVVKPTHGSGSVLVRRADTRIELERTLASHAIALQGEPAAALWPDRSVVIEEYLAGAEVDIDMLVQRGELRYAAVTDNFAPIEPYFMELGGEIPSTLPEAAQRELVDVALQTVRALGAVNGCFHFEARWTARGAVPIEANLRLGGAEVYEFNRSGYGVDLVEGAVRIALGMDVPTTSTARPKAYLRSTALNPERSGVIAAIDVEPGVWTDPGLGELVLFREVGTNVRVPPEGFDYIGWMVARGSTRDEAASNLARLRSAVRFEIATPTGGSR